MESKSGFETVTQLADTGRRPSFTSIVYVQATGSWRCSQVLTFQPVSRLSGHCLFRPFTTSSLFVARRWHFFRRVFFNSGSGVIRRPLVLDTFAAPSRRGRIPARSPRRESPRDHLLLDSAPNLGPLISRWEINKFNNCCYKSVRILEVLKLLLQQFLNLTSSQRDMSGPILWDLSNNRWSVGTKRLDGWDRWKIKGWFKMRVESIMVYQRR